MDWDTKPGNSAPYKAILPARSIISEMNPTLAMLKRGSARYRMAMWSKQMNFDVPDSAPARLLNEILWKSIKGFNSRMPEPRHSLTLAMKSGLQRPVLSSSRAGKKAETTSD